jgi:replicative DNA helicase
MKSSAKLSMRDPISQPHSVDSEMMILAAMVQEPLTTESIVRGALTAKSFFMPHHGLLFNLLLEMLAKRKPIGFFTVKETLRDRCQLDEIGGSETLNEFWSVVSPSAATPHYVGIVKEKEILRHAIEAGRKIIELAQEPGSEFAEIRDQIEQALTTVSLQNHEPEKSLQQLVVEWHDGLSSRAETLQKSGFFFGVPSVDRGIGALRPGDYVVVSAETSGGKSLFAFQGALNAAMHGLPTACFSLEMSNDQLLDRMFSHLAQISMNNFSRGQFTKHELAALNDHVRRFVNLPLFIEQRRGSDIATIASKLRQLKSKHGIKVALVDYLQRVRPSVTRRDGSRYLEVAEVSDRLKSLALELDIVLIAPCQLNDDGKTREARSIEHDADVHLQILTDEKGEKDDIFVCIEKHRQGRRRLKIPLRFNGEFMTLEERQTKPTAHWQDR